MNYIFKAIFYISVLFAVSSFGENPKEEIKIGVLAHKGIENTKKTWEPTAKYLTDTVDGKYSFKIVPLKFEEFPTQLRDKKVDFIVTNSAYYVDLESRYGISRIATLKNMDFNGKAQTEFGGVIFTKSSNGKIRRLQDLKNRSFAAVDASSFGGWIMALRELKENKIDEGDLKVSFYGTHENVVYAVLNDKAEAGTVRSDTLERMAAEGKINLDDFRIINQKNYSNFYYISSTRLYPEWPFAKTKHVKDELAEKVAVALISMPENHPAALSAKSLGWTIPLDYQSIHECLKELELGPYEYLRKAALAFFIEKYWPYMLIAVLLIVISLITAGYIAKVNNRLREARRLLREANSDLEEKIAQKTQHLYEKSLELENAYLNEKYLRQVLRTVADVNQLLITSCSLDELLDRSALCLSSNESFKSAKICLEEKGGLEAKVSYGFGDEKTVTELEKEAHGFNKNVMISELDDKTPSHYLQKAEKYGVKAVYILPLRSSSYAKGALGTLTITTATQHGFSVEEQKMLEELAGDIGFAVNSFTQKEVIDTLHEERIKSYQDFIEALVDMIEQRDTYTAGHTERVAKYSKLIAEEMGLGEEDIKKLTEAAKLHDIGKVVTPDSILLKPGALNTLEYELIKEHVTAGYQVLSNVHFYQDLAEIVAYHHEKYDGSGYPHGKKAGEIPILGHILAVADSFDAMTTNRIYKPRKSLEESLKELNELSGTWYHPAVVSAAQKALKDIQIDTSVNQIGNSAIDEERLSYFFKDRLTKLYNEDYLTLTLNGRARMQNAPKSATVISLVNFTKFNKEHTWEGGNKALAEFGKFLTDALPKALIFRIWGDHFVIADYEGDIEELLEKSSLKANGIEYKIKTVAPLPLNARGFLAAVS